MKPSKFYSDYYHAKLFVKDVEAHDRWMDVAFFAERWGLKRLHEYAKSKVMSYRWSIGVIWKTEYDLDVDID